MPCSVSRLLTMSSLALCACAGEVPLTEVAGSCADAFGSEVCTWATVQGDALMEVGATIPVGSLERAPHDWPMAWPPPSVAVVPLPEAVTDRSGLTHLTMYWEPMGHAPAAYMVPHFDFHFYRIPSAQRMTIDCSDLTKPATLAAGYSLPDEVLPDEVAEMIGVKTLVGVCVPEMGMHSLETTQMESDTPFDGTMVVGYYRGENIFIEPMIAKEFLLRRTSFDMPVPAIPGLQGPHPTQFRADYDAEADAYRFVFSSFSAAP